MKDIPLPTLQEIRENHTEQVERFIRDVKWYLYFKCNTFNNNEGETKETY